MYCIHSHFPLITNIDSLALHQDYPDGQRSTSGEMHMVTSLKLEITRVHNGLSEILPIRLMLPHASFQITYLDAARIGMQPLFGLGLERRSDLRVTG